MTDGDKPFLRAVLAAPRDDLPRLVWADFLDDTPHHGPGRAARAAFVGAQVALAAVPEWMTCPYCSGEGCAQHGHGDPARNCGGTGRVRRPPTPEEDALRRREKSLALDVDELGKVNWWRWAGSSVDLCTPRSYYYEHLTFRRGFVERVDTLYYLWQRHHKAARREHPIAFVRLADFPRPAAVPVGRYGGPFRWYSDARRRDLEVRDGIIPYRVYRLLNYRTGYPTAEDAIAAVSRALLHQPQPRRRRDAQGTTSLVDNALAVRGAALADG